MGHKIKNIADTYNGAYLDSQALIRQLAKMANVEAAGIRRMVLVVDVYEPPRLYTEHFLDKLNSQGVELSPVPMKVEEKHVDVSTTSLQATCLEERKNGGASLGNESPDEEENTAKTS